MKSEKELTKREPKRCLKCVYRTKINSRSTYNEHNVMCYYCVIKNESRVFEHDATRKVPKEYCDRFIEGEAIVESRSWISADMTFNFKKGEINE